MSNTQAQSSPYIIVVNQEVNKSDKLGYGIYRFPCDTTRFALHSAIVLNFKGRLYNSNELYRMMGIEKEKEEPWKIIIHLYVKYGIDYTLSMLEGSFAFILIDQRLELMKEKIYVATDKLGLCPIFMCVPESSIIFLSVNERYLNEQVGHLFSRRLESADADSNYRGDLEHLPHRQSRCDGCSQCRRHLTIEAVKPPPLQGVQGGWFYSFNGSYFERENVRIEMIKSGCYMELTRNTERINSVWEMTKINYPYRYITSFINEEMMIKEELERSIRKLVDVDINVGIFMEKESQSQSQQSLYEYLLAKYDKSCIVYNTWDEVMQRKTNISLLFMTTSMESKAEGESILDYDYKCKMKLDSFGENLYMKKKELCKDMDIDVLLPEMVFPFLNGILNVFR
jgi:hypothetical protein